MNDEFDSRSSKSEAATISLAVVPVPFETCRRPLKDTLHMTGRTFLDTNLLEIAGEKDSSSTMLIGRC